MSGELPQTEAADPATTAIDALDSAALARTLAAAHGAAVDAAVAAAPAIARAIDAMEAAIRAGRRVYYVGAGSSGRLAVLDAAEIPPTFGVAHDLVHAAIAGGDVALRRAVEGAEDDAEAGKRSVAPVVEGDMVVGISASGGAAFVRAALRAARERGAVTVAVVNSAGTALAAEADIAIRLETGAEPIAGSTRLKAGTAQKIALNTMSTGVMIRLGKTYRNRMVDLVPGSAKLRARAERLVRELAGDGGADAAALLAQAGGKVKTAVVMARLGCDRAAAETRLAGANGRLAAIIDAT
ncbi:MAG: N-acetylmuramic acid 6-phosphate etherase [Candidatus Velthaea sp.]